MILGYGLCYHLAHGSGFGNVQSAKQDTWKIVRRISPIALFAAYAVMSFPDSIGVMAARFGMEGSASTLIFLWFALLPIPAGKLCGRMGGRRAVALSLGVTLPAFVLLWQGQPQSTVLAGGFALAGIANVLLQTSVPVWAAEMFGAVRLSGWLAAGLFVRMVVAIGVPFAVAALSAVGDWRLVFPLFSAVTAGAACTVWHGGVKLETARASRGSTTVTLKSVAALLKDRPAVLAAVAFSVAVIADIAFNLSVPTTVTGRFGGGGIHPSACRGGCGCGSGRGRDGVFQTSCGAAVPRRDGAHDL